LYLLFPPRYAPDYEAPEQAQATPNTVDLAIDLLLSSQARKHR